jgi:hypothetical protein
MENVTKITARWSAMALAALVVLLPAEQVLAQAEQKEAISVQQAAPSGAAARLLRVPPLTENAALLLRTSPDRTPFADALLAQENWFRRRSPAVKVLLVVLGVIFFAWGCC